MMKKWRTVGVLLMLVLLAAGIYAVMRKQAEEESAELYHIGHGESIETIHMESANGTLDFFKNGQGRWMVRERAEYLAGQEKMELLVHSLENLIVSRTLDAETDAYGLTPPAVKVSFVTSKGDSHAFSVGAETMTKAHVYAREEQTGEIVIVSMADTAQLGGSLNAYRSREIYSVDIEQITKISLERQGQGTVSLASANEGWQMEAPYQAPAREIEISELLADLKDWNVCAFADTLMFEEETLGLGENAMRLTLADKGGNVQTLEIGAASEGLLPVRVGGKDDILILYEDEVDFDVLAADRLLFFAPLRAAVDEVATIEVSAEGTEYLFTIDSENDIFTCNGESLGQEAFYSFFVSYIGMTAQAGDDGEPKNGEPEATLKTVYKDGTEVVLSLQRRDGKTCYMTVNNRPSGFYLSNEKLITLIEKINRMSNYQ